jgi:hypothetical protein
MTVKNKKVTKMSSTMSKKVSQFINLKVSITSASSQLAKMKSEAATLESELMLDLEKADQLGVTVKAGSIELKKTDVFNAKDWKKIETHILKTKNFSFLQRRLSSALLKEMFEDTGKTIEGVEHFTKKSLLHIKAKV